ncbi:MAG TPA: MFS transporter [Micromonosporaceae bacterium]
MNDSDAVPSGRYGGRTTVMKDSQVPGRWPAGALSATLFLVGASTAISLVALPLFAKDDLAADHVMIALYFAFVAIAGTVLTYATGLVSDSLRDRRRLIWWSLLWLTFGHLGLSYVSTYLGLLVCGVLFYCALNVATAQLFAYGHDWTALSDHARNNSTKRVGLIRTAFSAGSFTGFTAGGVGIAYLNYDDVFRLAAGVSLASLTIALGFPRRVPATKRRISAGQPATRPDRTSRFARRRLLPALAGILVIFASGRVLQVSQLPIVLRDAYGASPQVVGFALSIPPLAEIVLMPVAAIVAVRFGRGSVFLAGGICGALYYVGLTLSDSFGMLLALQLLYAIFGAATLMVGIDIAQSLAREEAGFATSTYFTHETVAVVNGSLVAAVSVHMLGSQNAFAIPFAMCLFAVVTSALMFLRYPMHFDFRVRRHAS